MKNKALVLSFAVVFMSLAPLVRAKPVPVCKSGFVMQGNKCVKAVLRPSPSASCLIKANLSSKKEKIYHLPGCPNYKQTLIDAPGEKMFCTEKEARDAGWRKALNCPN